MKEENKDDIIKELKRKIRSLKCNIIYYKKKLKEYREEAKKKEDKNIKIDIKEPEIPEDEDLTLDIINL